MSDDRYDKVLKGVNAFKLKKLNMLNLLDIPKGEKGNLKYLGVTKNKLQSIESFWTTIYKGQKEDKILDFGCGTGRLMFTGRECGFKDITGLDINQKELFNDNIFEEFHKIYQVEDDVEFYDGVDIPFKDNTFDSIIFFTTIMADFTNDDKIDYRIKQLIDRTVFKGVWYVAPVKDIKRVIKIFNKYNTKNITLIRGKL